MVRCLRETLLLVMAWKTSAVMSLQGITVFQYHSLTLVRLRIASCAAEEPANSGSKPSLLACALGVSLSVEDVSGMHTVEQISIGF